MSIFGKMMAFGVLEEAGLDLPSIMLKQQTLIHGMAIRLGIVEYDEEISGKELIERCDEYLNETLSDHEEEQ